MRELSVLQEGSDAVAAEETRLLKSMDAKTYRRRALPPKCWFSSSRASQILIQDHYLLPGFRRRELP